MSYLNVWGYFYTSYNYINKRNFSSLKKKKSTESKRKVVSLTRGTTEPLKSYCFSLWGKVQSNSILVRFPYREKTWAAEGEEKKY